MDILINIIAAFISVLVTIISVYAEQRRWTTWSRLLVVVVTIYAGFNLYDKFHTESIAERRQKDLEIKLASTQKELSITKTQILAEQNKTLHTVRQTTMAMLDLQHPTAYKQFVNFRLGLMWYWLRSFHEAIFHFRRELVRHPEHIPSKYNLAIVLLANREFSESKSLLLSIPQDKLSRQEKNFVQAWLWTLEQYNSTHNIVLKVSKQWDLWRLP